MRSWTSLCGEFLQVRSKGVSNRCFTTEMSNVWVLFSELILTDRQKAVYQIGVFKRS